MKTSIRASIVFFIFIIYCLPLHADSLEVGVKANGDVVSAQASYLADNTFGILRTGVRTDYRDRHFFIGEANLLLENNQHLPGLRYGIGFSGLYGEADKKHSNIDSTVAGLGFAFSAGTELSSQMNPVNMPVEAGTGFIIAPGSLCFKETDFYQKYYLELKLHVLANAYISTEYIYRNIEFTSDQHYKWRREDHILVAGITLKL